MRVTWEHYRGTYWPHVGWQVCLSQQGHVGLCCREGGVRHGLREEPGSRVRDQCCRDMGRSWWGGGGGGQGWGMVPGVSLGAVWEEFRRADLVSAPMSPRMNSALGGGLTNHANLRSSILDPNMLMPLLCAPPEVCHTI